MTMGGAAIAWRTRACLQPCCIPWASTAIRLVVASSVQKSLPGECPFIIWTGAFVKLVRGHMIVIVRIGGQKYYIDVGFGANGPITPMHLDRSGAIRPHITPASVRLQWRNIPQNHDPDQRLWVYEHRIDNDHDWEPMYCFTELEFLPGDYQVMNLTTSTSPTTFFTQMVFMEKKLLGNDGEIVGNIIIGTDIKWRVHGKKEREIKFESEDDRVKAIEENFGIKLGIVERESILGLVSQIK